MRMVLRAVAVAAVVGVLAPEPSVAQNAPLTSEIRKDWLDMKKTIVQLADAMPADKFSYKPTPAQGTFGERLLHVAESNVEYLVFAGKARPLVVNMKATSKTEILKALTESFDFGTALIDEQTDQAMLQTVKAGLVGNTTRLRLFNLLIGHAWDIYGQMAVYVRLNGITPPASRQP